MRQKHLLILCALILSVESGQSAPANPLFSTSVIGAVSGMDTIVTDIGKLEKIYALKSIISDIPDNMIAGIRFDKQHRLYVATYGYGRFEAWISGKKPVYKVETDGKVSVFAEMQSGMLGILGVGNDNSVFLTTTPDRNAGTTTTIHKVTEDGKATVFATGFKQPCSGLFDPAGNMYLVDALENKVYKLTPQGQKSVILDLNTSSLATGLLFHGMAFDSSFSICYLAGYSAGMGKVLKCSLTREMNFGPLELVCQLTSPRFVWVDGNRNAFVTYSESRIARISPDGTRQLFYNTLYSNMLDDFSRRLYILSKDCMLYRIMEDEAPADTNDNQQINLAPRLKEFSVYQDSFSCGGYKTRARVEDETNCNVRLFLRHEGESSSRLIECDSQDSTLYSLPVDGYAWGDSLAAWLEVEDEQGLSTVSDTLGFCFKPFMPSDLDSDGGVDIFDLLALLRVLSGSGPLSEMERCTGDLDHNGNIDIFDLLSMLKQIASSG